MAQDNRRQAVRVECDLPVRLTNVGAEVLGQLVDLSRTGIRIRIAGSVLGVHRLSSLVQITRRLKELLGGEFTADLHYEMLGSLVSRTLTTTRIAKRDWEGTDVEIGCQLSKPLSDDEVGMLGVPLPAIGRTEAPDGLEGAGPVRRSPGERPDPEPQLDSRIPPGQYDAFIYPEPGKLAKPLITRTGSLTRGMAILDVQRRQGWDFHALAVTDVVMALDHAYGTAVMLRIVDGENDLWAGPAEIQEVDVNPDSHEIRIGVAFGREMRSEELGRLGLPTPA